MADAQPQPQGLSARPSRRMAGGAALMLKGYRIVARRHRTKLGEIDLIARRGDLVLIVEVKARRR